MKGFLSGKNFGKGLLLLLMAVSVTLSCVFFGCTSSVPDTPRSVQLSTSIVSSFDPDTYSISWTSVEHADEYSLVVRLDDEVLFETTTKHTTFQFEREIFYGKAGYIYFYVKALAHTHYTDSNQTESWWYRQLNVISKVQQLVFDREEGILSWSAVEQADYYVIDYSYGTVEESVETTQSFYDFEALFSEISPVTFSVSAVKDNIDYVDSERTVLQSFIVLDAPANISYSGGTMGVISWEPVENAVSYELCYEHNYLAANGTSTGFRSPSASSTSLYFSVSQTSYTAILYATNQLVSLDVWVRAIAPGYQSSQFVKYTYRP